jgi:hypothetical protein
MVYSRWPAQRYTGAGGVVTLLEQLGQHRGKAPIAAVTKQQAHRDNRLPSAAVQLQATVRPVR